MIMTCRLSACRNTTSPESRSAHTQPELSLGKLDRQQLPSQTSNSGRIPGLPNLPTTNVCASISPDVNLMVNQVPRNKAIDTEFAEWDEGKPDDMNKIELVNTERHILRHPRLY